MLGQLILVQISICSIIWRIYSWRVYIYSYMYTYIWFYCQPVGSITCYVQESQSLPYVSYLLWTYLKAGTSGLGWQCNSPRLKSWWVCNHLSVRSNHAILSCPLILVSRFGNDVTFSYFFFFLNCINYCNSSVISGVDESFGKRNKTNITYPQLLLGTHTRKTFVHKWQFK